MDGTVFMNDMDKCIVKMTLQPSLLALIILYWSTSFQLGELGLVSAASMSGLGPSQEAAVNPPAVRLVSPTAIAFPASFPIQEQKEPQIKPSSIVSAPIPSQLVEGQKALELPKYMLPNFPLVEAQLEAVVNSVQDNINSFVAANNDALHWAGSDGLASAYARLIAKNQSLPLLSSIATATSFGYSSNATRLYAAYSRAVQREVATNNIGAAALAILHAFLLHGGPGPAIATANALGAIVKTVGCGGVIIQSLQSVLITYKSWNTSQDVLLGYTVAQNKYLAGCWAALNDAVADTSLSKVQPLISTSCASLNVNAAPFVLRKTCLLCKNVIC